MQFLPGSIEATGSVAENNIWDFLVSTLNDRAGSCGYRIPSVGVADPEVPSFVLISPGSGILLIDVIDEKVVDAASEEFWIQENGNQLVSRDLLLEHFEDAVSIRLKQDLALYDRAARNLRCDIQRLVVLYRNDTAGLAALQLRLNAQSRVVTNPDYQAAILDLLDAERAANKQLSDEGFDRVVAALDGTNNLLPRQERVVLAHPQTKRDFLDLSRSQMFKLDEEQRPVSLQVPNGPQRIRGLAGTGKTVILSLKAALTHKSAPGYRILYLFNTKSLYDIVRSHISRYYIPETRQEPDWSRIDVLHAWGGRTLRGLYFDICQRHNIDPLVYDDIRNEPDQLDLLYKHILSSCQGRFEQTYDLVLIDEAQDFPPSLFQTIYHITKDPKRIVWAYDEFQTLSDTRIPEPEELFGLDRSGQPHITSAMLRGEFAKSVKRDYVLPNSYRTSRVGLAVAHGIALGIKNKTGFVDMIDDKGTWRALGYEMLAPAPETPLAPGVHVDVERPDAHSKNILESTLRRFDRPDQDLLTVRHFENQVLQLDYVAEEIARLIKVERVAPEEIMVVTIDPRQQRSTFTSLRKKLSEKGVGCITPGVFERAEIFREPGLVTLVSPFRAKGNEADIVFVIDAEQAASDITLGWIEFRGHLDRPQPLAGQKGEPWEIHGANFRANSKSRLFAA